MADEENARYIEVESDSALAVYLVNNPNQNSEYSDILLNIRTLKEMAAPSYVLRYVERSSNLMAIRISAYSFEKRAFITRLRCCPSDLFKNLQRIADPDKLNDDQGDQYFRLLNSFYNYTNRDCSLKNINSIPLLMPEMSKTWFSTEDVEELRSGLLNLFRKKGSGSQKRKFDMDMMRLIDACRSAGNNMQRSGRKCTKRQRIDNKKIEDVTLGNVDDDAIGGATQNPDMEEKHMAKSGNVAEEIEREAQDRPMTRSVT
ncbi:hypothetical protein ACET3Z_025150 [Daucus carota]